jgi:hypothetical protein
MTGAAYPDRPLVTEQTVKWAWELAWGARLPAGEPVRLTGRAWSGSAPIAKVEINVAAGTAWTRARLEGPRGAGPWTRFRHEQPTLAEGPLQLWVRATDTDGRTQPATEPFNTNGYLFGAVVRHPVVVA